MDQGEEEGNISKELLAESGISEIDMNEDLNNVDELKSFIKERIAMESNNSSRESSRCDEATQVPDEVTVSKEKDGESDPYESSKFTKESGISEELNTPSSFPSWPSPL